MKCRTCRADAGDAVYCSLACTPVTVPRQPGNANAELIRLRAENARLVERCEELDRIVSVARQWVAALSACPPPRDGGEEPSS